MRHYNILQAVKRNGVATMSIINQQNKMASIGGNAVVLSVKDNCSSARPRPVEASSLVGKRFGRYLVISQETNTMRSLCLCVCDCGNRCNVRAANLTSGHSKSCGCFSKYRSALLLTKNISGKRFGMLVADSRSSNKQVPSRTNGQTAWNCTCDCGKKVIVVGGKLKDGTTKSCGCLHKLTDEERRQKTNLRNLKYNRKWKYRLWKASVVVRDKCVCRVCFKKISRFPVAHHLDGYHWANDKRFDIKNGVTLCGRCHIQFHKTFGYRNNTKEQFGRFIKGR